MLRFSEEFGMAMVELVQVAERTKCGYGAHRNKGLQVETHIAGWL